MHNVLRLMCPILARVRCDDLMKINTSFISEITERKHESTDLRRELLLYEERKETEALALLSKVTC